MLLDMTQSLPEADARILRKALEDRRSDFIPDENPNLGFEQMRDALSAEPFDPEAFAHTCSEFRARQ